MAEIVRYGKAAAKKKAGHEAAVGGQRGAALDQMQHNSCEPDLMISAWL